MDFWRRRERGRNAAFPRRDLYYCEDGFMSGKTFAFTVIAVIVGRWIWDNQNMLREVVKE